MGMFRIEINAIGGHGCEREKGDGKEVYGCRRMGCPDCETRQFVEKLQRLGMFQHPGVSATLTHWPGQPDQVVDDLLTRVRTGGFK